MRVSNYWRSPLSGVGVALLLAACGGKAPEAKAPQAPATSEAAPGTAPTAEPTSTAPTTTTATLSGSDPGTKLPAAGAPGTPAPKADDPPKKGAEPGRGREDIQAIVVARRDEARACYDEGLKKNPSIEGDLDITWKIDPEGNVVDAGVDQSKSTIHDEAVSGCIIAILKKVKFAKSAKGFETKAHYPFNFHPKAGQVGKGGAQGTPPKN
jgi:hypothetical protein